MPATCSVSPGMPTIVVPAVLNLSRHLERGLHDNGGYRTRDALLACVLGRWGEWPLAIPPPVSASACVSRFLDASAPGRTSPLSLPPGPHARGALLSGDSVAPPEGF